MDAFTKRVCDSCVSGHYRLRDFADHLPVTEWTTALDTIYTSPVQETLRLMRLPEIDWTDPDNPMPSEDNITTWGSTGEVVDGQFVNIYDVDSDTMNGMRPIFRSFNDALKRHDRDPLART